MKVFLYLIGFCFLYAGTTQAGGPWGNQYCNIKTTTINRLGSYNNIINAAALNANSYSSASSISGFNECIISYSDTQNLGDAILIFGSVDNISYFYIGTLYPVWISVLSARYASSKLKLAPITHIKIYNSSSTPITAASCTLVSA